MSDIDFPVGDSEEVEEIKADNCYNNKKVLRGEHITIPLTKEQAEEMHKCYNDIIYFCNNYVRITTDKGVGFFKTYEFQERFLHQLQENRFNIAMLPRQSGKCVDEKTEITLRNKKTKEIMKIPIGKFYDTIKATK